MMKISTKGRYALRSMVDLAVYGGDDYVSLKRICERQDISPKYLEQIISLFNKAGYLDSIRGPQGGYKLSKDPSQYTVGDILRITEGELAPVSCMEREASDCPRSETCEVLPFWDGLNNVINNYIDSVTLADLVKNHNPATDYNFNI